MLILREAAVGLAFSVYSFPRERDLAAPLYLYTQCRYMLESPALAVLKHKASLINSINIYGAPTGTVLSNGSIKKDKVLIIVSLHSSGRY